MKIFLAFPVLPPVLDGIGDYTARLAQALDKSERVGLLTGDGPIDLRTNLEVWPSVLPSHPDLLRGLEKVLQEQRPDWLVLQYNPFSYGRWGLNPLLPLALRRITRRLPALRVAVMVHEPFVPAERPAWIAMSLWQRWQFWMLGRTADVVFLSIAPWADRFESWFPKARVYHLPVGCNIPDVGANRAEARRAYGFADEDLVVGFFGSGRPARQLPFVRAAVESMLQEGLGPKVLYVGGDVKRVRPALAGLPLVETGPLAPDEVSRSFAAMDLYLAPFRKGVSTRRGSFMVGLQHGLPTVTTVGRQTDSFLREVAPDAFRMASDDDVEAFVRAVLALAFDAESRTRVAAAGRLLFNRHFTWTSIAASMLTALHQADASRTACQSRQGWASPKSP